MKAFKILLLVALTFVLVAGYSPAKDAVNRLRYVSYHDRCYYQPDVRTLQELPVNGEAIVLTGEKVIGLAVVDTASSMQFQKERKVVPTLLILKLPMDRFLLYSLSGGP